MAAKPSETWTTRSLLEAAANHLKRKGVDSARLAAEILLAHVLEVARINLYADLDRPASELERAAYRELIERAAAHEPVQYLVGEAHFFSMTFQVDRRVLIPRPSTESLLEHVIQHTRLTPGFTAPVIADVGTGSGCIAIALAKNLPGAKIIATDQSDQALELAAENAHKHNVSDRIDFRLGDLLAPLQGEHLSYIVSNPPYISDAEWQQVPPMVKDHEPAAALRGGPDGLACLKRLVEGAAPLLKHPGQLVLEIAASQDKSIIGLLKQNPHYENPHILPDHERLPRVAIADRTSGR